MAATGRYVRPVKTISENTMEALLLLLLHDRDNGRGRCSHNVRYIGVKRGSNLARTMEADGLVDLDEVRSGSYMLGLYARLTDKGLELAEQVACDLVPEWIEVRANYWDAELSTGEAVRFVDEDLVVAEGTLLVRFNGGGGLSPDGKHRILHLLRPLKPGSRAKPRQIRVFAGGWQSACPFRPYGAGSPVEVKERRS